MTKTPTQTKADVFPPFKVVLILAIFTATMLLTCITVIASSLYVVPSAEIPIRRGQGTEYKIVAMVKDGAKVDVIEETDFYKKVRTSTGREGWMLSRFLSPDPPLDSVVANLVEEKKGWQEESAVLKQKIEELTLALHTTKEELQNISREREELGHDYETLQRDTADVVQIKQDLDRTAGENGTLVDKLAVIEEQYNLLKKDSTMYWFLAGAGVLVFGIILGKMPGPSRRRKSSLL